MTKEEMIKYAENNITHYKNVIEIAKKQNNENVLKITSQNLDFYESVLALLSKPKKVSKK